jgi:TRAP-type C4-dicarboxylate transport system substrate-binding protein
MTKKLFLFFWVAVIGITLMATSAFTADSAPTKLTFSIFFPPTHGQTKAAMDWAKEIEKLTGNKVQITVFPGGTLTKAPQCYSGVVEGISDLGFSLFAYTRGRFPVMAAVDLPMGYPNGKVASMVAQEFANEFKPKELTDVKVLYLHAHGPGILHTKKPVRKLEDLKGMKIRATGLSAKVVQALGGVPVAMPRAALTKPLKKGLSRELLGPWKFSRVGNRPKSSNIPLNVTVSAIPPHFSL